MSCLSGLQLENNTNKQEKAHEMYLLYQQMRQKVSLLAHMKVPQQSACLFYSRIMPLTTRTVWFCTCRQVTVPSAYCIHFV